MREETYRLKEKFFFAMKRNGLCISTICVLTVLLFQSKQPACAGVFPRISYEGMEVSQKRQISGTIVDDKGESLIGVTVAVKNGKNMCLTDADGHFNIWLNSNESTLIISYIGMKTMEVAVLHDGPLKIVMKVDDNPLNEVIVTGYQTLSRERTTGSFNVVTADKLKDKLQTNIISRLEGMVPGLVYQNGEFYLRGMSTLRGGPTRNEPLLVVDGLPFEGNINSINPSIVKNVTFLKDAAAASIYGARAANGVIVITTIDGKGNGKTSVQYDASIKFTPAPNMSGLHRLNSRELVDLQKEGFKYDPGQYAYLDPRERVNPVLELLYKNRAGMIDDAELEKGLDVYRNLDNRKELEEFYTKTGVRHQHNVSISGGNWANRYVVSLNYDGNNYNARYLSSERYGFSLRDNILFFKWLKADLGVTGSFSRDKGDTGMGQFTDIYHNNPSYTMLRDKDGTPINFPKYKSDYELERLKELGLMDESFNPITNRQEENFITKDQYYKVQLGLNFKIIKGLNFDVRFQTENTVSKTTEFHSAESYYVRNMINDAAQYNSMRKTLTLNVPKGAQMGEYRSDVSAYTLRAQLNFSKEFGVHNVTAIAGGERRQKKSTGTSIYYMGFDESSLGYKPVNPLTLSSLMRTEALTGYFMWQSIFNNYITDVENRFVSFYGNAAYCYDNRYDITGSIRVDQSNLFGTDPKFQYRPLWSVGGAWHIMREKFWKGKASWIDNLTLRLTYGIGGNVPKDAGPYLTLEAARYNQWSRDFASAIKNPPNPTLRWEKTATTNVGVDFAFFGNRITGALEFYNKRSNDLLANREADPTLGWRRVTLNYGTMYNRGIEFTLSSNNIRTTDFSWSTTLNFDYNKNKLIDIDDSDINVFGITSGNASVKGYPLGAIFSFRYAGLDGTDGTPQYYIDGGNSVAKNVSSLNDIVYSGTRIPKYNGSLTNIFTYKNFNLSLMFVYYGGHVLRGEAAPFLSLPPTTNVNRDILNRWQQPGDEKRANVTPAFTGYSLDATTVRHPWYAADVHVIKGDYIKLRDLSFTYTFDRQLTDKWGVSNLALTLQVQNLLTWHANNDGIDPEALGTFGYGWGQRGIPNPTTWTIGLSAKF